MPAFEHTRSCRQKAAADGSADISPPFVHLKHIDAITGLDRAQSADEQ